MQSANQGSVKFGSVYYVDHKRRSCIRRSLILIFLTFVCQVCLGPELEFVNHNTRIASDKLVVCILTSFSNPWDSLNSDGSTEDTIQSCICLA